MIDGFDISEDDLADLKVQQETMAEQLTMISDCEQRESRMNQWETDFIASVQGVLESEIPLTLVQSDKLGGVWERVTADG